MAFWQLTVPASAETSDGLTNFLWEQGALGVVEEETPGSPAQVRAFFAEATSSTGLLSAVNAYRASLRALGFAEAGDARIAPLLDEAWASAWQQSFPARDVGRRLRVVPPWLDGTGPEARDAVGRLTVVIEPGRAFGTGHHGTTEGCLVLLEEARSRPRPAPRSSTSAPAPAFSPSRPSASAPPPCSRSTSIPTRWPQRGSTRSGSVGGGLTVRLAEPADLTSRRRSCWRICSPTPTSPSRPLPRASSRRVASSRWAACSTTRTTA